MYIEADRDRGIESITNRGKFDTHGVHLFPQHRSVNEDLLEKIV